MNEKIRKLFVISFLYVGLGTLSILSMFPDFPLYGDWSMVGFLLTIPVSFISFGIAFSEPDSQNIIVVTQLIILLILWSIIYLKFRSKV
jgi:hypothetical protein